MHGEIPRLSLAPIGRKCQLNVAKCQDKSCDEPYLSGSEETMDFQIKLFSWPDRGNHVIMIVRGLIDTEGCNEMFRKIGEMTLPLLDCKVLIDLIDAKCELQQSEIEDFANGLKANLWSHSSKIALVAAAEPEQYDQLQMLAGCLSQRGFKIAGFYDSKVAVDWLADIR